MGFPSLSLLVHSYDQVAMTRWPRVATLCESGESTYEEKLPEE